MQSYIIYLLESSVCMLALWLIYNFALRKHTYFGLNRIYLLSSLIISLIIPLITIPTETASPLQLRPQIETISKILIEDTGENPSESAINPINNITYNNGLNNTIDKASDKTDYAAINNEKHGENATNTQSETNIALKKTAGSRLSLHKEHFTSSDYLFIVYITISLLIFIHFSISISKIIKIRKSSQIQDILQTKVAINESNKAPFSFIRTFYCSQLTLKTADFNSILQHEKEHIRHLHSLDLLLISVLKVLFWLNPAIYLIEKALKENHEFTADNSVIKIGVQKRQYKEIILRSNYADLFSAPVNSFSTSIIKKRFKMLDTKKSTKVTLLKYAALLPIIAMISLAFSCQKSEKSITDKNAFYEKMMKSKNGLLQNYDMNGREIPYDSAYHHYFVPEFKTFGIMDIPKAALEAGLTNYTVNVGILIDSSGKILFAKTKNAQALRGESKDSLGFGIEAAAEKYLLNSPKLIRSFKHSKEDEIENPIPGYSYALINLQFGNKEVWDAVENNRHNIYCHNIGEYNNDFMGSFEFLPLHNFVKANLKYPESQIKSNISGKVIVTFGIGENQKIGNIKIKHGINEAFDKEAMRVMNEFAKTNSKFAQIDPDHPYITKEDIAKLKAEPRYKNKNLNLVDPKYRFVATYPIEFQLK